MSQYPSMPPPGAYVPPNQNSNTPPAQGFNAPQQQPHYGGYQQNNAPQYGAPAPAYGSQAAPHKPTNAFGQALNQAMTTGKPMLNKLGKTISSKLGSKPVQGTPQHLESYHNYQQHQQQTQPPSYQNQGQQFNPQTTPQQQPQHQTQLQTQHTQPQQSTYTTPQQSPFQQSSYGTPASANSGQSNYFSQQAQNTSQSQAPQQQPNMAPSYNPGGFAHAGNTGSQTQNPPHYGHANQPPPPPQQPYFDQAPPQGSQQQSQSEQYSTQQTGVVRDDAQPPNVNPQSPHMPNAFPNAPTQPNSQQHQWTPPAPPMNQAVSPPPPTQAPHPNQPTPSEQQYSPAPPVPTHPNQQQQQWNPTSPVSPQQSSVQQVAPQSPPPPHFSNHPPPDQNATSTPQHQHQPPPMATKNAAPQASPTEFIAELPADLANMSVVESSKPEQTPSTPYQAYRPSGTQSTSPRPGFTVSRRAVSMSSMPLADPWRFADPATELPTREFFIIADLVFDALDRKFEPHNTGLIEAPKILESWKVHGFAEEAARLFTHNSYMAFGKLWSLEGIPHLLVPCEPALTPLWNFQQQPHAQELRIPSGPALANSIVQPTYIPALNRAGFYKYFFLAMMHEPESLDKMLAVFCADTYKPGVLNQPDLQRRDKTPMLGLEAQASAIHTAAVSRVCQEMAALVQGA